jgi:hypothetical protein
MKKTELAARRNKNKWESITGILLAIILLPFLLLIFTYHTLSKIILTFLAWIVWCSRGKFVLFVWSDSPIWKEYIQREILPKIESRAVILNWSQRNRWNRWSLAVNAFHFFGGKREFNPIAIVFRPLRQTQIFRFWKPFNDFKRGDETALKDISKSLLESL